MAEKDPKAQADFALDLQKMMTKVDALVSHIDSVFSSIADKSQRVSKNAQDQNAAYQKGAKQLSTIRDLNASLIKDLEDQAKSARVKTLAMKTGIAVQIVEIQLAKQQAIADAQKAGASEEQVQKIRAQYNQAIILTKEIVHQAELRERELKHAEEIEKYDTERAELLENINKKAFLLKNIFTDQRLAQAILVKQLMSGYESIKEAFIDFRKEGLTVSQAFSETGVAMGAMFSLSGASLQENAELMGGMAESMGNMNSITTETVREVGFLAKTLGVSAGEAGKLQGQLMNIPGATAQSATNTMEFAGALAKAAHVAPGAVMKDMAANAEEIAINTKNGGKDMAVVSVAAHKLGIEMSSITKMSSGLLDFENSINKQMEASVLLGREINLDKAREAALNGDLLGATQEMLKNVGGEAEFNRMNVLQRKALAESMGVSVQDLSKMVKNQKELANLTEEQQMALAEGSATMDEVLANAGGVGSRLLGWGTGIVAAVGSLGSFASGLKNSAELTKSIFDGWKEGAGLVGKVGGALKGSVGMSKVPKPEELTKTAELPKAEGPGKEGMLDKLQKIDAKQMLSTAAAIAAVGVALIGVGLGIKFASEGLAVLVQSFKGLTGTEMLGALGALLVVMGGFAAMVYILATASTVAAIPLLAIGAAFLMIGGGIAIATVGIGYMVKQLGEIPYDSLTALPAAMLGIGAGLYMMGAAGAVAIPTILALIALAAVAPQLAVLGTALGALSIGGSTNNTKNEEEGATLKDVKDAIDNLATAITTKKGDVTIDGRAIGHVLAPFISREINYTSRT